MAFLKAAIWTMNIRWAGLAGGASTAGGDAFVSRATAGVAGGMGFVSFALCFVRGAFGRLTGGAVAGGVATAATAGGPVSTTAAREGFVVTVEMIASGVASRLADGGEPMSYQPSHCGIAKTSTKVTAAAAIPIHMPRNGESDGSSISSSVSSSSHAGSWRAGNFSCASRSRGPRSSSGSSR